MGESVPASPPLPLLFLLPSPFFPPSGREGGGWRARAVYTKASARRPRDGGRSQAGRREAGDWGAAASGGEGRGEGGRGPPRARSPARPARRRHCWLAPSPRSAALLSMFFFHTEERRGARARGGIRDPRALGFFFPSPSLVLRGGTVRTERGGPSPSARPSFFFLLLLPSPVLCRRSPSDPVEAEGGKGERRPCLCKERHVRHLTLPPNKS